MTSEDRINAAAQHDKRGRTRLMLAVLCDDIELVEKFLASSDNPNLQDIEGNTVLHYAFLLKRKAGSNSSKSRIKEIRLNIIDILFRDLRIVTVLKNKNGVLPHSILKDTSDDYNLHAKWFRRYMIELTVANYYLEQPITQKSDNDTMLEKISEEIVKILHDNPRVCDNIDRLYVIDMIKARQPASAIDISSFALSGT